MLFSIIASYLPYALVTAFTPGPNNIVALHAVSQNGWRRGKNVLLGMSTGFLCVMVLCALFCSALAAFVPSVAGILKYVGAVYILWLAVHIARSRPEAQEGKPMSFWKGFCLQFMNVKIILYAITVYTGYVLPVEPGLASLLLHGISLTIIGAAGFFTWAAAGGVFQKFLTKYYRPFNIIMAFILLWCASSLAFDL